MPLDDRFADSPEMLQLLADYQEQLKRLGFDELGPRSHSRIPPGRKFVGSEKCGECHTKAFADLGKDAARPRHRYAGEAAERPRHIARHFDPECLSCHVTGWEPQKYFPFDSGYLEPREDAAAAAQRLRKLPRPRLGARRGRKRRRASRRRRNCRSSATR